MLRQVFILSQKKMLLQQEEHLRDLQEKAKEEQERAMLEKLRLQELSIRNDLGPSAPPPPSYQSVVDKWVKWHLLASTIHDFLKSNAKLFFFELFSQDRMFATESRIL